jgi:hypothetical protein
MHLLLLACTSASIADMGQGLPLVSSYGMNNMVLRSSPISLIFDQSTVPIFETQYSVLTPNLSTPTGSQARRDDIRTVGKNMPLLHLI